MNIRFLAAVLIALLPAASLADCSPARSLLSLVETDPAGSDTLACGRALELSGPSQWCHWKFDLRSDASTEHFHALSQRMNACEAAARFSASGPTVNHPDSYGTRRWTLDGRYVTLALKDKSALGATYVFLRVTRTDQ